MRLGLAGGAIYFYNTSSVFAEEPTFSLRPQPIDSADAPTLNTLSEKAGIQQTQQPVSTEAQATQPPQEESLDDLESQAGQEGAFNPETGEINWDCPCLGGMAHGPCGEEFKAAFSCFVYSTEEPKGMDCIEKFKFVFPLLLSLPHRAWHIKGFTNRVIYRGMQDCFRLHPDIYGSELQEDEVDEQLTEQIAQRDREEQALKEHQQQQQTEQKPTIQDPAVSSLNEAEKHAETEEIRKADEHPQQPSQQEEELVPRAWHESSGEPVKKTEK